MPTISFPLLPSFKILKIIARGSHSCVYEAVHLNGGHYAIKVLSGAIGAHAAADLRKEAAALARLNHPNIVKIEECHEVDGLIYLVMELVPGVVLSELLHHKKLEEKTIVAIAKDCARGLGQLHSRGLIHRDIKPDNIMWHERSGATLIDFGFTCGARALCKEHELHDELPLVGTFDYCSPEQLGIVHRPVDSRADLYSLGCVLYECSVGVVPLSLADGAVSLQQHLSKVPQPAHWLNAEISPTFAAIVAKLLAKEPDDRYLTADALLADLEALEILKKADPLVLGKDSSSLRAPHMPLVGRQQEMTQLHGIWRQVKAGNGAFVLIKGLSGSGKTRLVRDFIAPLAHSGLVVLTGKVPQQEGIPFAPLREAITRYLSSGDRGEALETLQRAAGEAWPLLSRTFREIGRVESSGRDPPLLDPVNEQLRFYSTIADFFLRLAQMHSAAILFIDDVQWLDGGSTEVLIRLASAVNSLPFLILATARSDPESEEASQAFVQGMGPRLTFSLELAPLSPAATRELIAFHLGEKHLDQVLVNKLVPLICGNPFVVNEVITALLDQGILRPHIGGWVLDTPRGKEISLPAEVIKILIQRISSLAPSTLRILSSAALVGFTFDEGILRKISSVAEVQRALIEGLHHRVIEKDLYGYAFVHDRVREALMQRLSSDETKELYQQLADTYGSSALQDPAACFALARFLSKGRCEGSENQGRIFAVHFRAGKEALAAHANQEAFDFLEEALQAGCSLHLSEVELNPLREALAEAASKIGRQHFARTLLLQVEASTQGEIDKARLYYLLALVAAVEGKCEEAWGRLQQSLQLLGAELPKNKIAQGISLIFYWAAALVLLRTGWAYGKAKGAALTRRKMISTVQQTANTLGYFLGDPFLMAQNVIRELYNVQWLPVGRERVRAHSFYTILMSSGFSSIRSVAFHQKIAVGMASQLGDNEALAYAKFCCHGSMMMAGDLARGEPLYIQNFPEMSRYLSAWDRSCFYMHLGASLSARGCSREAVDWLRDAVQICSTAENLLLTIACASMRYWQMILLNQRVEATKSKADLDRLFDQMREVKLARAFFHGSQCAVLLEREDFSLELEEHIAEFLGARQLNFHTRIYYLVIAQIRLEQLHMSRDRRERLRLRKAAWLALKEASFPTLRVITPQFRCHIFSLRAGMARESGHYKKAWKLLQKAEIAAAEGLSPWGAWCVARERARTALAQQRESLALMYARMALATAHTAGWLARSGQIRREFVGVTSHASVARLAFNSGDASSLKDISPAFSPLRRTLDALLRVSVASVRVFDPEGVATLALDQSLHILGAERGFFFQWDPSTSDYVMISGRDSEGNDLESHSTYCSTIVEKVGETRQAIIVTGSEEGLILGAESIRVQNLRSIMAAPVMVGLRLLGVLYIDSRALKGLFSEEDGGVFQAMANHIALSWETAQAVQSERTHRELEKKIILLQKEQELASEQLATAHAAGRAEIASNVLHTIGNILTGTRLQVELILFDKAQRAHPGMKKIVHDIEMMTEVLAAQRQYAMSGLLRESVKES